MKLIPALLFTYLLVDLTFSKRHISDSLILSDEQLRSERILDLTTLAVKQFNEQNSYYNWFKGQEILSGRKWLYKGALYQLEVELHATDCARIAVLQKIVDEASCRPERNSVNITCTFFAWQQIWGNQSVVIDIPECVRAERVDSGSPVREIHMQLDKSVKFTKLFQDVIENIGQQLKKQSRLPPDTQFNEVFYVVENKTEGKMGVLEYHWNRTGCRSNENETQNECFDKLPKETIRTCAAEFEWPYTQGSSWVNLLNCSLTPLLPLEEDLFSVQRLSVAKEFNLSLPISPHTFKERKLPGHVRYVEEKGSLRPEDLNWAFHLIERSYREHNRHHWGGVDIQELTSLQKMVEPTRLVRFKARLKISGRGSNTVLCSMVLWENKTIQVEECVTVENLAPQKSEPLSKRDQSQPWFSQILELLTEHFSAVNPLETAFAVYNVQNVMKTSVRKYELNRTLLKMKVHFRPFGCQAFITESTCSSDLENIFCTAVVENGTELSPAITVTSISDCWYSTSYPKESVSYWRSLTMEEVIEPHWQRRVENAIQVYSAYFVQPPTYAQYYATDVHVKSTPTELGESISMFQLNMVMEQPVNEFQTCQVVIKEAPGSNTDVSIYNCVENYLASGTKPSTTFRRMKKTEETSQAFVELQKLAEVKANRLLSDTEFYHKLSHIQENKIKNDGTANVEFEMVLLKTDCNRTTGEPNDRNRKCKVQDFATAVVCHVKARSLSWLRPFHYIHVNNCHRVLPTPPHLALPSTYLDIVAAETPFSVILKQIEVDFNLIHSNSKYFGLVAVDEVKNHSTTEDIALFVTLEVIFQATSWEKKEANIFVKSEDFDKKNQNLVACNVTLKMLTYEHTYELFIFACNETSLLKIQLGVKETSRTDNVELNSTASEAATIINKYSHPDMAYQLHRFELLKHEKLFGDRVTFNIYLRPYWNSLRSSEQPKHFLICRGTNWIRKFPRERNILEIRACHTLDLIEERNQRHILLHEEFRKYYLDPLLPRFFHLITGAINISAPIKMENIWAYGANPFSGTKFDFLVNFKVENTLESCLNVSKENCHPDRQFYQCYCTFALRDWSFDDNELEVVQCNRISRQTMTSANESSMIPINIYTARQQQVASDVKYLSQNVFPRNKVIYGDPEIRSIEENLIAGQLFVMTINIRPVQCNETLTVTECEYWRYSHYLECKLVGDYLNRHQISSLSAEIRTCRKVLNQSDIFIKPVLLLEGWNFSNSESLVDPASDNSKLALNVKYSITELDNIEIKFQNGRFVKFNVKLQPKTCQISFPLRQGMNCMDILQKGYMSCIGEMYEGLQVDSERETRITDCQLLQQALNLEVPTKSTTLPTPSSTTDSLSSAEQKQ